MQLNTIKPQEGSKKLRRRVGRGIGSGLGKTAGRGHKGQKSRAGGYHKVGFEGGQMPMQRRLPKRGFKSHALKYNAEITLSDLQKLALAEVDMLVLKQAGLVRDMIKTVKVSKSGELSAKIALKGVGATAGAKAAIEKAGGAVKVVIGKKGDTVSAADVKAYCEANLTGYKRPRVIEFRADLPKSPVGKILRRELRDAPK